MLGVWVPFFLAESYVAVTQGGGNDYCPSILKTERLPYTSG